MPGNADGRSLSPTPAWARIGPLRRGFSFRILALTVKGAFLAFCVESYLIILFFLSDVRLSQNFVRFHEIHFQTDADSFGFLS